MAFDAKARSRKDALTRFIHHGKHGIHGKVKLTRGSFISVPDGRATHRQEEFGEFLTHFGDFREFRGSYCIIRAKDKARGGRVSVALAIVQDRNRGDREMRGRSKSEAAVELEVILIGISLLSRAILRYTG